MSRLALSLALAAFAPIAAAQQQGSPGPGGPGPMPMMAGGGPGAASMLLSHTGDLKLTDAQVTRLAAIARRTSERRSANRTAMDSMRSQFRPSAQGAAPAGPPAGMRTLMERTRTQEHDDLRDALAVLNPDQLATAWQTMSRANMMGRGGPRMGRMGRMGQGRGFGRGFGRGGPGGGPGMGPQGGGRGMRAPGDSVRTAPARTRRPESQ